MNKLFLSIMLALSSLSLFADAPPPPPPSSSNEFRMSTVPPNQPQARQIRVQIDISENDVKDYGIQQGIIFNEVQTRMALAQIQIKDDPKLPQLALRVKSIQADRAVATYIQLAFYEEAQLTRNQNTLQALTWSQATLISCAKEDLIKEINQLVIQMTNNFILDYQKALSPQ